MVAFSGNFLNGHGFFLFFYGANAFEAVEKIAIDEKDYYKCSFCAKIYCTGTVENVDC